MSSLEIFLEGPGSIIAKTRNMSLTPTEYHVDLPNPTGHPTNWLCRFTEFHLILISKGIVLKSKILIPWVQLRHVTVTHTCVLLQVWDRQFALQLQPSEFDCFNRDLTDILCHLLSIPELCSLGLSPPLRSKPSAYGCLCRFQKFLHLDNRPDQSEIHLVHNLIRFRRPAFRLSEFRNSGAISYAFFNMLALCDSLESVHICVGDGAPRVDSALAWQFASIPSFVKFLKIDCDLIFPEFYDHLSRNAIVRG
jgi:hypothetical protein